MCTAATQEVSGQVSTVSTTNQTVLVTPFILAPGIGTVMVGDELRALVGSFSQTVRHRFAQVVPEVPSATWTAASSSRSTAGSGTQAIDLSATTDQMFVQFSLAGKVTSGEGEAFSRMLVQYQQKARIIGRRVFEVNPLLNASSTEYLAAGEFFDANGLTGMMFAARVTGISGTLAFRPAWRTADTFKETPNAWADLDSSQAVTVNTLYNSGTETTTPGTVLWAQPGLSITSTSARGRVELLVAGIF